MSKNERQMAATTDQVWQVIADPYAYAHWVVGAKEIRGHQGSWPEKGALLHHTVGTAVANVKDNTEVLEVEARKRLKLRGRVRPIGIVNIVVDIDEEVKGMGATVRIKEAVVAGPISKIPQRLLDPLLALRNAETLRRLERLALKRVETP